MTHALSLSLTLSPKEREQRSPRAEASRVSPFLRDGLRLSLPQRGRAGVRENRLKTKTVFIFCAVFLWCLGSAPALAAGISEVESNNTRALANTIPIANGVGAVDVAKMGSTSDVDYFRVTLPTFSGTAGVTVTMTPTAPDQALDAVLKAEDSAGNIVATSDSGSDNAPESLSLLVGSGATFYIRCSTADIFSLGSGNYRVAVTVSFPSLAKNTNSFSIAIPEGANAASRTFNVWNAGGGPMTFTNTSDAAWLSVSPTTATSTGLSDVETVSLNFFSAGLLPGNYSATITITAGSATNSPMTVSVSLLVVQDPNDRVSGAISLGAITNTVRYTNALSFARDVDLCSFTVTAGQRLSFDIDRPDTPVLDSVIRLFDSSGNQLAGGFNNDGRGPGEPASVESYLEYTFTNSGTFYVGVSGSPNTNYSGATGTNDVTGSTGNYVLVVSTGLAGTARRNGDMTDYPVDILPIGGKAIDAAKRTWIVTHGWTASRADPYIVTVASNLALRYPQDQVLTLDWSAAAVSSFQITDAAAEDAIKNVGIFAADALLQRGFTGDKLNLVGHSWGSYVSDELAERIPGGVNTIVALDPGEDHLLNNFYDPHAVNEVNFAQHSMFSWAFYSADLTGWLGLVLANAGDEATPTTADEAFVVQGTTHSFVVFMFADLLLNPLNVVAPFFDLDRLLAHSYGPWQLNQADYSGGQASGGGYEAVVVVGPDSRTPTGVALLTPASLRVTSASTMVITNNDSQPLLGKGTDFGTILAGGSTTNFYSLENLGGSNLVVTFVTAPIGFNVVSYPGYSPIEWSRSAPLVVRFAPQSAGTFSGDVVIYNNATGAAPFRFAVTGTATNPPSAPVISVQPTNRFGVAGSNVLLSVSATGTTPFFYQWQKNGQAVTDATNSTLNLTNLVRASGGIFSVFVTNQVGNATSSNAIVRVLVPQRFAQAPVRLGNGQFRLLFGDPVGSALTVNELTNFVVEASTSVLSTNWVRYTNGFSIVGGQVQFDDPDSGGQPRRFYRVIER